MPRPPGWLPFHLPDDRTFAWLHLIVVAVAGLVAWLLVNLRSSATGRAVRAAAQHTDAAAAMGVDAPRVGTITFGLDREGKVAEARVEGIGTFKRTK